MSEVLLARANQLRRPHAALETLVLADAAGGLRVRKRVPSWAPAAGRIDALLAARERLRAPAVPVRVPEVLDRGEDWLEVEWVAGESALARLERALLERRFEAAAAELRAVLAVLDGFPALIAEPAADPRFVEHFGTAGGDAPGPCVVPGLYDFGLDNLVWPPDGGAPVLVDWEWAFPFPVPRALVAWVAVRHSAEYLQPLVRALASPALPVAIPFDGLAVPERWLADADLAHAGVARHLAWECAFQDWLHVVHRPFADHVVHPQAGRATARLDGNAAQRIARLEVELEVARGEAWQARRELADLGGVKRSARHLGRLVADRVRARVPRGGWS